jgi:hypothetical protein
VCPLFPPSAWGGFFGRRCKFHEHRTVYPYVIDAGAGHHGEPGGERDRGDNARRHEAGLP